MFGAYRQLSRNTVVLAASIGIVLAMFFTWNPLLPLYLRTLGANDVEIGASFSIFIFAHTIPALAGGMLADRFGRKWIALGPGLILSPLYIMAGFVNDWRMLVGILVCTNLCSAVQWPAMQALIAESDETTCATAFSLIEIFVLVAAVIGPLIGSLGLSFIGVGGLIIGSGLILLPATWIRAREWRETHQPRVRRVMTRMNWRTAIRPATWWLILANALFTFALGVSVGGPFMAMLARDVWSLDDPAIQQLTALGSLAAFGGVWLGSKADQWGNRRMWTLTAIGFAAMLVGWGLAPNVQLGAVFIMTSNFFFEALFIVSETLLAQHTTRATRSFLFGLSGTLGGLTEAAGPILGAGLVNLARLPAPFLAGAVASLCSVLTILPLGENTREENPVAPAIE